jgi:hypothetical protein
MTQAFNKILTDPVKSNGLESEFLAMPSATNGKLQYLLKTMLPAYANLVDVLYKSNYAPEISNLLVKIAERLDSDVISNDNLQKLPIFLREVHDQLFKIDVKKKELDDAINELIKNTVICLGIAIMSQRFADSHPGLVYFRQGYYNWFVSDFEQGILISKQRNENPFESYRLRRWVAQKLNSAGLQQPELTSIGRLPVIHAFTQFSAGKSLHDLLFEAGTPQASTNQKLLLENSLMAQGLFFKNLSSVAMQGYGRLNRNQTRNFSGVFNDFIDEAREVSIPLLDSNPENKMKHERLIEMGYIIEPKIEELKKYVQEFMLKPEPSFLGNQDPNLGNFLYDDAQNKIIALDWDDAAAMTSTELFSRIYNLMILYAPDYYPDPKGNFFILLEAFEPQKTQRVELLQSALKLLSVRYYMELSNLLNFSGDNHLKNVDRIQKIQENLGKIGEALGEI